MIDPATPAQPILVRTQVGAPVAGAVVVLADVTGRTVTVTTDAGGRASAPDSAEAYVVSSADAPGFLVDVRRQAGGSFRLVPDPDPSDLDADGLSGGEEAAARTDPTAKDTDSDGIADSDEVRVAEGFAPVAFGASPRRRDLFLEVDWWAGLGERGRPTPFAVNMLQAAFFDSPVTNVDGSPGITLHVDTGQAGGGTPVELDEVPSCWDPTFYDNVSPERRNIYFHAFVAPAKQYCGYSGLAYARRSIVVNDDGGPESLFGDVFGGPTFAHELGHTLGLRHGGFEDLNCKPNYPSIMNYDNLPMILSGHISFSRGQQLPIDEAAIDERQPFLVYGEYDFNHDGTINTTPYARDLTDGRFADPVVAQLYHGLSGFDPDQRCFTDGLADTLLRDHDDWSEIATNLPLAVGSPVGDGSWDPTDPLLRSSVR